MWMLRLSQKSEACSCRAMIGSKKGQECGRIDVVVNHKGVGPVRDIFQRDARRPAITLEIELPLQSQVYGKEIRKPELSWPGDDLTKLVNGHKSKSCVPDRRGREIKFLEL